MQSTHLSVRRLHPLRRPLRPPSALHQHPKPRLFTHNSQLLLVISPSGPRPQLPFLHPSSNGLKYRQHGGQWQLTRLLTTERKKYIKEQVWIAGKWTIFLWTSVGLFSIAAFGLQHEMMERDTPTPHEWSAISRMDYRSARAQEDPDYFPNGVPDWASTGGIYKSLLARLENPKIDGKDLKEQAEGGILVPGVGKAGYDIEAKSEPWRRGYFEVLMGCGKCAEHLDGWVKDTTRRMSFPSDVVIGPSNPNPRPCPPTWYTAPLEENCVPAYERPETFYMKILTTKGFNTRQRLEAALAYADWLDFKGLSDSAQEMYKWGLDIATSGVLDAESVIDTSTAVLREGATHVSENIVKAATSLATHHARNADVSSALPIYLSVLRARGSAPIASYPSSFSATTESSNSGILNTLLSFLAPPPYPPPPPSGDEALRRTPSSRCEEAALKTHIGEILFATAPSSRETGLAWTQDAVADAQAGIDDGSLAVRDRDRCAQCLEVALTNLHKMVSRLAQEEKDARAKAKGKKSGVWFAWGAGAGSERDEGEEREDEGRWDRERKGIEDRIYRVHRDGLREQFKKAPRLGVSWMG